MRLRSLLEVLYACAWSPNVYQSCRSSALRLRLVTQPTAIVRKDILLATVSSFFHTPVALPNLLLEVKMLGRPMKWVNEAGEIL